MLWAVTSYFNPCGYRNRLKTYRQFRERLNVPLVTVELGFDGDFDLNESDAEHLIQIADGDVMFQKERLLNIAICNLPPECTAVAWLDCDIVFEATSWGERVLERLDTLDLIQPYGRVFSLNNEQPIDFAHARREVKPHRSSMQMWEERALSREILQATVHTPSEYRIGLAWAARRKFIDQIELYDGCILGSGARAFAYASLGVPELSIEHLWMNSGFAKHWLDWCARFQSLAPPRFGALNVDVIQLWHGHRENRRYIQRHVDFRQFKFDPHRDLTVGIDGAWKWTDPESEMALYVRNYFASRREDG